MKTCPVCKAIAFDDALVCYGCLHRFEEGEAMRAIPEDLDACMDAWLDKGEAVALDGFAAASANGGGCRASSSCGSLPAKERAASAVEGVDASDGMSGWTMLIEFRCSSTDGGGKGAFCSMPLDSKVAMPRFAFTEDGFVVSMGAARSEQHAPSASRKRMGVSSRSVLRRRLPKDGGMKPTEQAEE